MSDSTGRLTGETPVPGGRLDTLDPTKYHENLGSFRGVTIPRAHVDGHSLGWDHNRPGKVVVDPGVPGGDFVLDLTVFAKDAQQFNAAAELRPADVSTFYRDMASKLHSRESQNPAESKPMADEMPIPAVAYPVSVTPVPDTNRDAQPDEVEALLQQQAAQAQEMRRKYFSAPPPIPAFVPSDPALTNPILPWLQYGQMLSAAGLLGSSAAAPTPPTLAVPEKQQTALPKPESAAELVASLGISFLTGVRPISAKLDTFFDLGSAGTIAAKYHAVVPGNSCLALVYDTRFEDGFQYLPPTLGDRVIVVTVPKLREQPFECYSPGLRYSLGCLDIVILLVRQEVQDGEERRN